MFQLVMPELAFPVANDDQCSESFTVTNTSDEPLELCAKARAEPWLADVLTVDVLSSSSSTHVNSFSLDPQQTMHIMLALPLRGIPFQNFTEKSLAKMLRRLFPFFLN